MIMYKHCDSYSASKYLIAVATDHNNLLHLKQSRSNSLMTDMCGWKYW